MTLFHAALPLALSLLLSACQTAEPTDPGAMTEAARADCTAKGGQPTRGLGAEVCAMPTADAGKACTDGAQCDAHMCLTNDMTADAPARSTPATGGHCAPSTPMFGCFGLLENGDAVMICID